MRVMSSSGVARLEAIRASQQRAEAALVGLRGRVVSRMQNLVNAVSVEVPEENAAQLSGLPGVRKVFPVTVVQTSPAGVSSVSAGQQPRTQIVSTTNAGLGMKIGIIDTGITPRHPSFHDPSLPVPPGYPMVSGPQNQAMVNNKIIVARDYQQFYTADSGDSALDKNGHGTSVADCAAGLSGVGVAPKAYLGIYKVTPSNSGTANAAAIAQAIDDAFGDGMDVVNVSLSSMASLNLSVINYYQDAAAAEGLIIVHSAGDSGPAPAVVFDGADTANTITVGAVSENRTFGATLTVPGLPPVSGTAGLYPRRPALLAGALNDVSAWDPQLGCSTLPAGSLTGQIALLPQGICTIGDKLNNAQAAGARGAVVYGNGLVWSVGAATLPAMFVNDADAAALVAAAPALPVGTMDFTGTAIPPGAKALASFSGRGPTDFFGIKPDLAAPGVGLTMATQSVDQNGPGYDASGYITADGTSYAAAIVAGAAAVLKAARPGLTAAQYKSLLINSASPLVSPAGDVEKVQHVGAGTLDLNAALKSRVAVSPTAISFGSTYARMHSPYHNITITNVGRVAETFTVGSIPFDGDAVPTFSPGADSLPSASAARTLQLTLQPGQFQVVSMQLEQTLELPGSEYHGLLTIRGNVTGSAALLPYWSCGGADQPAYLTIPVLSGTATTSSSYQLFVRQTDQNGLSYIPWTLTAQGSWSFFPIQVSQSYVLVNWYSFSLYGMPVGSNSLLLNFPGFPAFYANIRVTASDPPPGSVEAPSVTPVQRKAGER